MLRAVVAVPAAAVLSLGLGLGALAGAVGALGAETFLLYLMVCWVHGLGIYAARPPTTIDNYLNDFAQNTPLRIYRSKYWHTHA